MFSIIERAVAVLIMLYCYTIIAQQLAVTIHPTNEPVLACQNTQITLSAVVTGGVPPYTFLWNGQGITNPALQNIVITPAEPTQPPTSLPYSVTVMDNAGTSVNAVSQLQTLPAPTVAITGATMVNTGSTLSLVANPNSVLGGPFIFQWTGPNNFTSTNPTISIPNVQEVNAGVYTVTVFDRNGCSATTQSAPVVVQVAASLCMVKTARMTMCSRSPVQYLITILNTGGAAATNLVLTDTLPDCLTFLSASGEGWSQPVQNGQVLTFSNPSLASGQISQLTINTRGNCTSGTTIQNMVTLKSDNTDQISWTTSTMVQ